jgi:hypothetical protein
MKRIKMAVMALAAMSSIGSAFAFSPAAKKNATTYYAVKSGNSFFWTAVKPQLNCLAADKGICTITTANQPVDGQVPAGHTATNRLYQ